MSQDYTETLKRIKETEEASSREILERRKALEADLRSLEEQASVTIDEAKRRGEALVADEVSKAVRAAEKEAQSSLTSSEQESKKTSAKKLNKASLDKIAETIILAEFE
jgi:vacuolar-type H+-ATPase subunit H